MSTPVKLYGPPLSTAVSRVLACLLEKDVQFQLIPVNLAKGEQKKPDYLKLQVTNWLKNKKSFEIWIQFVFSRSGLFSISSFDFNSKQPFGQVPVFQDEEISLWGNKTTSLIYISISSQFMCLLGSLVLTCVQSHEQYVGTYARST